MLHAISSLSLIYQVVINDTCTLLKLITNKTSTDTITKNITSRYSKPKPIKTLVFWRIWYFKVILWMFQVLQLCECRSLSYKSQFSYWLMFSCLLVPPECRNCLSTKSLKTLLHFKSDSLVSFLVENKSNSCVSSLYAQNYAWRRKSFQRGRLLRGRCQRGRRL